MPPKYSIIIPSYNGGEYLPSCVNSIINQDYDDYELIISDDHSTDGSKEYLSTLLDHPNITVIEPEKSLSMTEHWEWALSHAIGMWQIFVGQDDGLQAYFFKLADKLTEIAKANNARTIMSQRAYYFWPGCESLYGDVLVNYRGVEKFRVHNSSYEAVKALLGIQYYFELPEMYTTSLFHKSILNEARLKQGGRVLTCHPQDANLGVIACSLDEYYLKSGIPLGWVGSSPKSAGMAIRVKNMDSKTKELKKIGEEYTRKVNDSTLKYNELAGEFAFGDIPLYFWQAFLSTQGLRSDYINRILKSSFFKYIFFSAMKLRVIFSDDSHKKKQFKQILKKNGCMSFLINAITINMYIVCMLVKALILPYRVWRRVLSGSTVKLLLNRKDNSKVTMETASEIILRKMNDNGF